MADTPVRPLPPSSQLSRGAVSRGVTSGRTSTCAASHRCPLLDLTEKCDTVAPDVARLPRGCSQLVLQMLPLLPLPQLVLLLCDNFKCHSCHC